MFLIWLTESVVVYVQETMLLEVCLCLRRENHLDVMVSTGLRFILSTWLALERGWWHIVAVLFAESLSYLALLWCKLLPEPHGPTGAALLSVFCSCRPDTSLHCKTMDTRLTCRVVCMLSRIRLPTSGVKNRQRWQVAVLPIHVFAVAALSAWDRKIKAKNFPVKIFTHITRLYLH